MLSIMNNSNTTYVLDKFTQLKHYRKLFQSLGWGQKLTREGMKATLMEAIRTERVSKEDFADWFALHQIDGNNYSFVYNLSTKPNPEMLQIVFGRRSQLVKPLWNFTVDPADADHGSVLSDIVLIGIHRKEGRGRYIFSFVAPSVVSKQHDSVIETVPQMFFAHAVLFDDSSDLKMVLNPTSRLESVNGKTITGRQKWMKIADMFFFQLEALLDGTLELTKPAWLPVALHRLADDFSGHDNPEISEKWLTASEKIRRLAKDLFSNIGLDSDVDIALFERFVQDVQGSLEAQLIEKYGAMTQGEFGVFRQRSDGVSHIIDVESRETVL